MVINKKLVLLLLLSFSIPAFAQIEDDTDETEVISGSVAPVESIVDSLSETLREYDQTLRNSSRVKLSQSFPGNGKKISKAVFYIKKFNAPTGNVTCVLYAHSGTYGTSSVPTGSALETSSTVLDIATLTTSYALVTFNFASSYVLSAAYYCISIEYSGGDAANNLIVGYDASGVPADKGNYAEYTSFWNPNANYALCFYIYGY